MKLSVKEKASYGLGAVGKDMVYALSATYVLYYYNDLLHINPLAMGAILLFARVFDAFNDPIMVTATADDPNAWVGLYEKDAVPGSGPVSLYYHYVNGSHGDAPTSGSGQAFDVKQGTSQGSLSAGQYDVILFSDGGYNVAARVTITIAAPRDPEFSIDKTAGEDGKQYG